METIKGHGTYFSALKNAPYFVTNVLQWKNKKGYNTATL